MERREEVTEPLSFFSQTDQTSYSLYLREEFLRSAMNITLRKFHVEYESFLALRVSKWVSDNGFFNTLLHISML